MTKERRILGLLALMFFSSPASALVSGPVAVRPDQWNTEFRSVLERGKVEPNENRDSYQSAEINVYKISLGKGLEGMSFGADHFFRIEYTHFTSKKEEVAGQVFYPADEGKVATLTYGFNFVHEASYSVGMYLSVSPLADFNKDKFSNPRVDLYSAGLRAGSALNADWFLETSVHFGSGIPSKQNSYLVFNHGLGWRLAGLTGLPATLKFGPYAELDLQDRFDASYDAAFSAVNRTDRIRSMKIGTTLGVDVQLSRELYLSGGYVQKLGGYDAAATNATYFAVGGSFN